MTRTKKPILILQFRTDKSLQHEREQIIEKGGFKEKDLKVVNVLDGRYKIPKPKDLNKYRAVITCASGQFNVTDWPPEIRRKVERVYPFLKALVKSNVPTLAICFGHQLVAEIFKGKVKADKNQSEAGTYEITLTKEGRKTKLFKGIPDKFYTVLGHKDSVTKLPKGAVRLAYSKKCKIQAYKLSENFYSVQFHPELDRKGLSWRLSLYPEYMKGRTTEDVEKTYNKIPHAYKVVRNFRNMAEFD